MRLKLKNRETGKIKYISKPDDYPAEAGDTIRARRWNNFQDVWEAIWIKKGRKNDE